MMSKQETTITFQRTIWLEKVQVSCIEKTIFFSKLIKGATKFPQKKRKTTTEKIVKSQNERVKTWKSLTELQHFYGNVDQKEFNFGIFNVV